MELNGIICFPQSTNKMLESNNSSQQKESKIENNSGFLSEPMIIMDDDLSHINNSITSSKIIVRKQETHKKFFVKLLGYDPKFFNVVDIHKKINDILESYLKIIKVDIDDKIKKTFYYKGELINPNDTIKDIDHLSWIISEYNN